MSQLNKKNHIIKSLVNYIIDIESNNVIARNKENVENKN
jgi:hypothetical protein